MPHKVRDGRKTKRRKGIAEGQREKERGL